MRSHRRAASSCLFAAASLIAAPAAAVEIQNVAGETMNVDIVNTAGVAYRFDNRNEDKRYVSSYLDDNYGELLDRLDLQINWWRLQLGTRFDAYSYFAKPTASDPSLLERISKDGGTYDPNAATRELHSRYLTTLYPAKLWLGYAQPGVDLTVGDFYAQLGRGLVFSVRKLDELAIDTTVRGAKVVVDHDFGGVGIGATAFAGQLNPIRVDMASGRRLQGSGSPLFFGFPGRQGVGDLVTYQSTVDSMGNPQTVTVTERARPNYLEDGVVGGRLEGGNQYVQLAVNGSMLLRKSYTADYNRCFYGRKADTQDGAGTQVTGICASQFPDFNQTTASRLHNTIRTFSGSLSVPSIAQHGDFYVEVAGQQLRDGHLDRFNKPIKDLSGYAVYVAANASGGPVAVSLEGKHYRRFFPLQASIDVDPLSPGFTAPEFDVVSYNQPPTAEAFYTEPIGSPNICVTGGRGRVDYRFNPRTSIYAWVGRYVSFSELDDKNYDCSTAASKQTNTWDTAAGTEINFDAGRSHVRAWAGARRSDTAVPYPGFVGGTGDVFYSEGYFRYDVVKHLAGPFSLQLQGDNRRRYKPENFERAWVEGDNYVALQWSPHISAVFGYEYSSQEGCKPGVSDKFCSFLNGGLQWKANATETALDRIFNAVQLFVGQRRGGLRCVSGICRFFPPFEGARLDLVSKF